jgi:acetamidase/formamidase
MPSVVFVFGALLYIGDLDGIDGKGESVRSKVENEFFV